MAERGGMLGNRGVLHDDRGRLTSRRWAHRAWVCCVLSFKGRRRRIMAPRRYTELFFLDEAVALAAGHRPCGECRRAAYRSWADAWSAAFGAWPGPAAADAALHAARAVPGARRLRTWRTDDAGALPAGTFLRGHDAAFLLLRPDDAVPHGPAGYAPPVPRPRGPATVLTPRPMVAVIAAGYAPWTDPSADALT
ncbi:hypothetical protein [Jannaschia sp. LMIT008]|uniref:hypothetical protein n=1 Tax=Jannaschia maritima TaxID=3032585 RepID=UPI002810F227|nr:hypothetical protein [Jannaschia sp. LMIT008]